MRLKQFMFALVAMLGFAVSASAQQNISVSTVEELRKALTMEVGSQRSAMQRSSAARTANGKEVLESSYTITVSSDMGVDELMLLATVGEKQKVTIDLNGHTLTGKLINNGVLTIIDSSNPPTGAIVAEGGVAIENNGTIALNSGNIIATTALDNNGTAYIQGASLIGAVEGVDNYENAVAGIINVTLLQKAIDLASGNTEIKLAADITGDVTVVQKPDVKITIDGDGKKFYGTITVDGKSARYATAGLHIKNVKFDATVGISADACINLGVSGNNNTRYTNNVTVENCTFTDDDYSTVAVKSYTGGDWNLQIINCTAEGMHSLAQLANVEQGLVISGNTANTKNGINLNQTATGTIEKNTINVKGYAVRAGVDDKIGGNITLTENTLTTDNSEGDPVIVLRGTVEALNMTKNVVSGNTHIKGTATTVAVDENYWDGKTAPVVAEGSPAINVNSYYKDEALSDLARNHFGGSIVGYTTDNRIWGDAWGNAFESYVVKVLDAEGNVMGTTSLNNVGGIINGDVNVTWGINFVGTSNDPYWEWEWTTRPSINKMPAKVQLWIDRVNVSEGPVKLNAPDDLKKIVAATADADGNITGCYTTVNDAVANGDNIAILVAGTYNVPTGKNLTVTGAVDGVQFGPIETPNMGGKNYTFNNVTFNYAAGSSYKGLQHTGNMVYNNCTFNGQVFLYGQSETFNKCTFNQNSADAYNVWTYGAKEVAFNECTFNSAGKSVLVYTEDENHNSDIAVTASTFNASQTVDGKAAIEMDASLQVNGGITLTVDAATTATGFSENTLSGSSLWHDKKVVEGKYNGGTNTEVTIAGTVVKEAAARSLAGSGTAEAPYTIKNLAELIWFAEDVNAGNKYQGKVVQLTADIDLAGEEWTPIGNITYDSKYKPTDASKVFSGVFNGNGKVISNLKVESTVGGADTQANVGLFGITGEGAVIKDLTLTNVNIATDGRNVGAIAGFAYKATLENITVNGNIQIKGGNNVAGIAGMTRYYDMSATDITVRGDNGSAIVGNNIVGGIFAEIAPNGSEQKFDGLNVENVAITGVGGVGGIVGLLTTGAVENVSVKNVVLTGRTDYQGNAMGRIRLGSVAGLMGGNYATIANETVENVTAKNLDGNAVELPVIGANYDAASNATEAKIGNTYYNTLLTALNAAKENDTIVLISNITASDIITINKAITIDLNGKKVTSTAKKAFEVYADATIKNGAIEAAQRCVDTRKAVKLTLTDVELVATSTTYSNPQPLTIGGSDNGTQVTMENVEINAGTAGYGIITFVETKLTATESAISGYSALYVKPGSDNSEFNFVNSDLSGGNIGNDVEGNSFSTIAVRANNVAVNVDAESTVTANGDHYFAISFIGTSENTTTGSSVTVAGEITGNILDAPNDNTVKVKAEYAGKLAAAGYATIEAENGLVAAIKAVAKIGETAYATLEEAFKAATEGCTIKILSDVTVADKTVITKSITIDGNGKKLTYTGTDRAIDVPNDANANIDVTIKNLTVVATTANRGLNYNENGKFNVEGVTVTIGENVDGYAINFPGMADNAQVTIKNSKLTSRNPLNIWGENMVINVYDSEIISVDDNSTYDYAAIQLNNEIPTAGPNGAIANGTVVNVYGGVLTATDEKGELSNVVANATETGVVNISDETVVTGKVLDYVANIGGAYFGSLQAAVDAIEKYGYNSPIVIMKSFATSETATVENGLNVTIDLNGKTITGTDNATESFGLITNMGNLTITDSSEEAAGKITLTATQNRGWNAYSSVISNTVGGKLTVEGGTLEHLGGTDMAYGIDNLTNGKGTYAETVINGGTIKSTYRAIRQFLNGIEAQNILTINGGTVEGANKSVWMQDPSAKANTGTLTVGENAKLVGDAYLSVTDGSTEWPVEVSIANAALQGESKVMTSNVPAGYELAEVNGTYGVYTGAAKIGTAYYATIAEAIAAAQPSDIVTILAGDYTQNINVNKAITVVGETDAEGNNLVNIAGKLSISADGATVKNINVNNGSETAGVITAKNVTVEGCQVVGGNGFRYCYTSGTVTFKNSVITGSVYGIHFDGSAGGNIVIDKCTITGWTSFASTITNVALKDTKFEEGNYNYVRFYQDAQITNCTFNEDMSVDIAVNNADVTVESSTVEGGKSVETLFEGADMAYSNITVDGVKLVRIAKVGDVYYQTITEAINAAADGATVEILAGEHSEYVAPWAGNSKHDTEKSITIVGAEDFATTLTAGMYLGYDDSQCREHNIVVKGIVFKGKGLKVACQQNVTIEDNKFADITEGQAIAVVGKNINSVVKNNVIENVAAAQGIELRNTLTATVEGNTISGTAHNSLQITSQVGATNSSVTVKDNTMSNWGTAGEGRAMRIHNIVTADINGNVMSHTGAPEEFVKVTGSTTLNAAANYWNGVSPLTAGMFTGVEGDPIAALQSYYTDAAKSNLVTFTTSESAAIIGGVYYETLAAAIAAVKDGETITMLKACGEDVTIVQVKTKSFTIDGNNNTYTGTFTVQGDGTQNNTPTETLTFRNINFELVGAKYAITSVKGKYARNITVENCSFKGENSYGIRVRNGYNYTLKNVTVDGFHSFFNATESLGGFTAENVTVTNTGSAFNFNYGTGIASLKNVNIDVTGSGISFVNRNASTITLENCSIKAATPFVINEVVTNTNNFVFNGTNNFTATTGENWLVINDDAAYNATFNVTVNDANLDIAKASGLVAYAKNSERSFGSNKFLNVTSAMADGDVVTLVADVALDTKTLAIQNDNYATLVNVKSGNVAIDLNGKTVTVNAAAADVASQQGGMLLSVFHADPDAHLTITDSSNGAGAVNLNVNDAVVYSFFATESPALAVSGKMTINGGNYTSNGIIANAMIFTDTDEAITINGGNFHLDGASTTSGYPWMVNTLGNNELQVVIKGGTFNVDVNHQYRPFEIFVPETLALRNNGDGTWTVVPAVAYVTEKLGNTVREAGNYEHKVGYATLADAFAGMELADRVTMLSDVALENGLTVEAGREFALDLNGKTVSMEDASAATVAMIKNYGNLTITDSSEEKAGKLSFNSTTPSAANAYASNVISNYGTITVEAGTIENTTVGSACYALDNYAGSTATINGGKLTAEKTTVRIFNWTNGDAAKATLNVNGGEIYSKDGYAINVNSGNAPSVALNITGGTITTDDTDYNLAVYVFNNGTAENFTASVTGGEFNGYFALNEATCETMAQNAVSISGGTFEGVICYGEPAYGFISGGVYSTPVEAAYCAEGYAPVANEDGTYGVEYLIVDELTIVDGTYDEFVNQNAKTVGTLTYERTLNANNIWLPLFVPFEIPVSYLNERGYEVATFYDVHFSILEDGVVDLTSVPDIHLIKINGGTLKANYPYVIRAKSDASLDLVITLEGVTLYSTAKSKLNVVESSTTTTRFEFAGTYVRATGEELTGDASVPFYVITKKGEMAQFADPSSRLSPFRVYMTIWNKDGSHVILNGDPAASVAMRVIGEENEDGTTSIYDVYENVDSNGMIFDLQGRRVLEPQKGGMYIIDGKKVIY